VTVCIGVITRFTDKIVLVSDQMLSSDENSVEGVMKWATIAPGTEWYVMFAGDPSRFPTLMDRVREVMGDIRNTRLTLATVTETFERAYRFELLRLIEADILRPYGLSHDEFIWKGKRLLGEVRFNHVMDQIVATDLGIDVLVAGLDAEGQTQLFSVSPRGIVTPAALPYHAIGAGALVALSALYPLTHFPASISDLTETVYRVCAAKFAAEAVPSVGKSTHAMIISPMAGTWTLLMEIDRLRELWLTKGQPPTPPEALRIIQRDLKRFESTPRLRRRGRTRTG
jgi:hypothetical protein